MAIVTVFGFVNSNGYSTQLFSKVITSAKNITQNIAQDTTRSITNTVQGTAQNLLNTTQNAMQNGLQTLNNKIVQTTTPVYKTNSILQQPVQKPQQYNQQTPQGSNKLLQEVHQLNRTTNNQQQTQRAQQHNQLQQQGSNNLQAEVQQLKNEVVSLKNRVQILEKQISGQRQQQPVKQVVSQGYSSNAKLYTQYPQQQVQTNTRPVVYQVPAQNVRTQPNNNQYQYNNRQNSVPNKQYVNPNNIQYSQPVYTTYNGVYG